MRNIFLILIIFFLFSGMPAQAVKKLTLDEAILLAVRSNPNVQSSKLSGLLQKYNVELEKWAFSPQYAFESSYTYTKTSQTGESTSGTQIYNIQPSISWRTPLGTQFQLTAPVANTGNFNAGLSLQIMQPLLRGFGKPVVEAALNNAKDSDIITQLAIEGTLRSTVSSVISAYLDLMMADKIIQIDEQALKRAKESVNQTRLFIKAGHKAGNELVTVKANVASAELQLINDKNNQTQIKYALLSAIGIDPVSQVDFVPISIEKLSAKYSIKSQEQVESQVLLNDIQYQIDQVTLHGPVSRSVLLAKNNMQWQLDLSANASTGNGFANDESSWVSGLFNGTNRSQSVSLTLNVPINDLSRKQALMNAKIALKQAEIALEQEKWNKKTEAINGWNQKQSSKHALIYAESAEKLQEETYNLSYQKYLHGLIDSLQLQSAQLQLIQSQMTLLSAQMAYIKTLVNLDLLTGNTLKTWHIHTRL